MSSKERMYKHTGEGLAKRRNKLWNNVSMYWTASHISGKDASIFLFAGNLIFIHSRVFFIRVSLRQFEWNDALKNKKHKEDFQELNAQTQI